MKKGELGKCRGMFGDVVVRRLYRLTDGSVARGEDKEQGLRFGLGGLRDISEKK